MGCALYIYPAWGGNKKPLECKHVLVEVHLFQIELVSAQFAVTVKSLICLVAVIPEL